MGVFKSEVYMSLLKKLILFAAVMAVMTVFTACSDEQGDTFGVQETLDDNAFKIFRTDATESSLVWEKGEKPGEDLSREEQVNAVLRELGTNPVSKEMKRLLPSSVTILSAYFGLDGQLIVSFSKEYNDISTVSEVLLRAGYVKTLCQLDFVDYVEFYTDSTPLILRSEAVPGLMKSTDFIDNTGQSDYFSQEAELTVYYLKRYEKMLGPQAYIVTYDGTSSYEKLVTDILVSGPSSSNTEFLPTLPEGTVINKISSTDGIVYVDVNEAFLSFRENVGEELTVYSLVNTLCDLHGIMKVQITVNGTSRKLIEKYGQNGLIERKPELIANEKAGEADG